jgi:hypothetical protein
VPILGQALVTTGTANPDGTAEIDLKRPLAREAPFVGQTTDFTPLYVRNPDALGRTVQRGIASGKIESLFLVLQTPKRRPFPGGGDFPPVIGVNGLPLDPDFENDVAIFNLSYFSQDRLTFRPVPNVNFMFSLILSEPPGRPIF